MAKQIEFLSPKLLIVDYYDSLINDIDIYTEELLDEYSQNDILPFKPKIETCNTNIDTKNRNFFEIDSLLNPYTADYKNDMSIELTPGRTKIHDYLNKVRSKSIEEIKKVREENLQRYDLNKKKLKYDRNDLKLEDLRRELFKEKFCFVLKIYNRYNKPIEILFEMFTIVTDFYLEYNDRRNI